MSIQAEINAQVDNIFNHMDDELIFDEISLDDALDQLIQRVRDHQPLGIEEIE